MAEPRAATRFSERTAWARNLPTPVRQFLRTETGYDVETLSAAVRVARARASLTD